MSHSTQY